MAPLSNEDRIRCSKAACEAQALAYQPYSGFAVGAAFLRREGTLVKGCNIENASYSLTMCAERVALHTAVAAGWDDLVLLAVASPGGVAPCGACRQVLAEHVPNLEVLLVDTSTMQEEPWRHWEVTSVAALLPQAFGPEDLGQG